MGDDLCRQIAVSDLVLLDATSTLGLLFVNFVFVFLIFILFILFLIFFDFFFSWSWSF